MKLFAVGTENPNYHEWEPWNEVILVAARNKKQAIELCGFHKTHPAVEVDLTKPGIVMKMEPYCED